MRRSFSNKWKFNDDLARSHCDHNRRCALIFRKFFKNEKTLFVFYMMRTSIVMRTSSQADAIRLNDSSWTHATGRRTFWFVRFLSSTASNWYRLIERRLDARQLHQRLSILLTRSERPLVSYKLYAPVRSSIFVGSTQLGSIQWASSLSFNLSFIHELHSWASSLSFISKLNQFAKLQLQFLFFVGSLR